MTIRVLFFGATADEAGTRALDLAVDDQANTKQAFEQVIAKFPQLSTHHLLLAVNQEYVSTITRLNEGDELAVFTAVSGG